MILAPRKAIRPTEKVEYTFYVQVATHGSAL